MKKIFFVLLMSVAPNIVLGQNSVPSMSPVGTKRTLMALVDVFASGFFYQKPLITTTRSYVLLLRKKP